MHPTVDKARANLEQLNITIAHPVVGKCWITVSHGGVQLMHVDFPQTHTGSEGCVVGHIGEGRIEPANNYIEIEVEHAGLY